MDAGHMLRLEIFIQTMTIYIPELDNVYKFDYMSQTSQQTFTWR